MNIFKDFEIISKLEFDNFVNDNKQILNKKFISNSKYDLYISLLKDNNKWEEVII